MTENKPAALHSLEAATTARWLTRALAPARARSRECPSAEAVDRIRERVFGEPAIRKTHRSIAA
jgi:hypothetical protein